MQVKISTVVNIVKVSVVYWNSEHAEKAIYINGIYYFDVDEDK